MLESLIDRFGDGGVLLMAGLLVGVIFGASAQYSSFCLRASTIEVAHGRFGPRLSTWLIAFATGVMVTQIAVSYGILDTSTARQLAATGSMSGAIIGGLMFGVGMILARGCASRLLVLSATGNLRSLMSGLVLTVAAQASLRGILSPAREYLAQLWTVPGGELRNILTIIGMDSLAAAVIALFVLIWAIMLAYRGGKTTAQVVASAVVGVAVALGWIATYAIQQSSFEVVALSSVTFTGPSADTLMALVNEPAIPMTFAIGLIPGVFVGSGSMAASRGEFKIQRFDASMRMERFLIGAVLMGFGSMLAGGCAVGAGMSGGAIFALTAWVAVFFMWIGAMATVWVMEGHAAATGAPSAI